MSKSKRSRLGNANGNDNGGSITVDINGDAAGVAPNGDTAASTDNSDDAVAAVLEAADSTAETVEPTAEIEIDPEILALLSEGSTAPAEPVVVADPDQPEITEDDGVETVASEEVEIDPDVTIEEADEDAILSELDADADANADPAAAADPAATTTRKKREPKAPAAPVRQFSDVAAIDPAAFKTNLDGSAAKKVNEKVANMIQAVETGKKLSNYTKLAVNELVAKRTVSGKSLAEMFMANNLSRGTAAAQSQQMTALFKIAGLATPSATNPRELELADENLANELVSLAG